MIKLALAVGFLGVFGLVAYFGIVFAYSKIFGKPTKDKKTEDNSVKETLAQ
jgi:hypothetical protein